ncbi:MAG: D-alanine--D-alanine ligase [Azospirillaceae bacterium]|nr:D-alanine--D-alanine ligase [Azospirillaceae bacterium]
MSKHVAVLMGGWSSEREVSLVSGAAIVHALEERGYRVTAVDVQRDLEGLLVALTPRPDVIFNALHGRGGEDGTVQGILEFLNIPYTHSGVKASAVAMDKPMTKRLLASVGVPSPRGVVATWQQLQTAELIPAPYVVKPTNEGSSVGIRIIRAGDNRPPHDDSLSAETEVLIEEYIPGRELTVGVMDNEALAVTEIRYKTELFDYTAKYSPGYAVHQAPADIPPDIARAVMRMAEQAHITLGCAGVSRSDFRWDDSRPGTEGLFFLEINTQPGMTPLSLVPEQAAVRGLSFGELVSWMVENATCHA